jgi:hypothetical protein
VEQVHSEERKISSFSAALFTPIKLNNTVSNTTTSKSIFQVDADDSDEANLRKKRKLMVLEHEMGNHNREKVVDAKALTQAIIDKIPTSKEDLFKFPIDWDVIDQVRFLLIITHTTYNVLIIY